MIAFFPQYICPLDFKFASFRFSNWLAVLNTLKETTRWQTVFHTNMGDNIHPCPENDSAGTATVTDYVDPLYEFRAPMYYDFTNPNEDVYDGDLWFGKCFCFTCEELD